MRFCTRCGKQNEDYCNYCTNDGENLNNEQSRLLLKETQKPYCDMCGSPIKKEQTYCSNCGTMLSEVVMRTKNRRPINQPYGSNIKKVDLGAEELADDAKKMFDSLPNFFSGIVYALKNFNYSRFIQNNLQTAILTALVSVVFVSLCPLLITFIISIIGMNLADLVGEPILYNASMPRIFLINLIGMSVPKLVITSYGVTEKIAIRMIIGPLISGCLIALATKIMLKGRKDEYIPLATLSSLAYSVIMVIISLFTRYSDGEGTVYYSILSVFINSFVISFIAMMMALEKENAKQLGTIANIFRHNLKIVVIMLTSLTVFFLLYILMNLNTDNSVAGYYSYIYNFIPAGAGIGIILLILVIFFVISPIVLLMLQFVVLNLNGFYVSILSIPQCIVFTLIPIIVLIIIGRNIKTRYGEGKNNIIALYSVCYATIMLLLSYFSKIVSSGDTSQLGVLSSLINNYGGSESSSISEYMGTSSIMTVLVTLVLSSVCMYIGYRTKKID